jgi:hypothetical protein
MQPKLPGKPDITCQLAELESSDFLVFLLPFHDVIPTIIRAAGVSSQIGRAC